MTFSSERHSRLWAFLLALTLALTFSVHAFADAWEPPDEYANRELLTSPDGRKAISIALSNILETGLAKVNSSTTDSALSAALLKHFELNQQKFAEVYLHTDDAGQQYMEISASKYESEAAQIFNRYLKASECTGYSNGKIYVTVSNPDAPISVLAAPNIVRYAGNGTYYTRFVVFSVEPSRISGLYGDSEIASTGGYTSIGIGNATFTYRGEPDDTEFSYKDFRFSEYECNYSWHQYDNVNTGYTPYFAPKATQAPSTEPSSVQQPSSSAAPAVTTEKPTEKPTEKTKDTTEAAVVTIPSEQPSFTEAPVISAEQGSMASSLLLIIVLILIIAVLATVVIVLAFRKNKTKAPAAVYQPGPVNPPYPPNGYGNRNMPPMQGQPPYYPQNNSVFPGYTGTDPRQGLPNDDREDNIPHR